MRRIALLVALSLAPGCAGDKLAQESGPAAEETGESGDPSSETDDTDDLSFSAGTDGNLSVEPELVSIDLGVDPYTWDLRPAAGSSLIDAGDPSLLDEDGSVSDIGAW